MPPSHKAVGCPPRMVGRLNHTVRPPDRMGATFHHAARPSNRMVEPFHHRAVKPCNRAVGPFKRAVKTFHLAGAGRGQTPGRLDLTH